MKNTVMHMNCRHEKSASARWSLVWVLQFFTNSIRRRALSINAANPELAMLPLTLGIK
jgi:hypothetical protein